MLLFTAHSALSPNLFLARSIYPWDVSSIVVCLLVKGDRQSRKSAAAGRVQASLLGVGAPEALVIGVVALLVFGPKGLAEVKIMCNSFCILLSFLLCTLLHPACSIRVFTDGKSSFRITPFFVLEKSSWGTTAGGDLWVYSLYTRSPLSGLSIVHWELPSL